MYDIILVPHGGTSSGDEALKHAIHIGKQEKSKIIILHVIPPWPTTFDEYDDDSVQGQIESILSSMEAGTRKFLAAKVAHCRKEGLECDGIFRTGKPAEAIIKFAEEIKADLIIMAKKKKDVDIKSFFKIGGVAKKVQEKAACSILLVETEEN